MKHLLAPFALALTYATQMTSQNIVELAELEFPDPVVAGEINKGDWETTVYAPHDYWACGVKVRYGKSYKGDDFGVNGLHYTVCGGADWSDQLDLHVEYGYIGSWTETVYCAEG